MVWEPIPEKDRQPDRQTDTHTHTHTCEFYDIRLQERFHYQLPILQDWEVFIERGS